MSSKRSNDNSTALAIPLNKKAKSELVAYAAKNRKLDTRTSSLFAPIVQLVGHESEVFACEFSPDGNLLSSAGFDRKVSLWNVYGECENWTDLTGHTGAILGLKFNYDGTEIITCATDKTVVIWDLNTCERSKKYKTHKGFVNAVDTSRQTPEMMCSASDDNTVKLWDRRKKNDVMSFDSSYPVLAVCFNESADQVVSGGLDNSVKVWDIRKNGLLYEMKGHTDSPTGLSLSPDGAFVATNAMDNTLKVWDIRPYAKERCLKTLQGHTHNFEKNLLRVSWSPDGRYLSAGSSDKYLYIWDYEDCKIAYKLPGHLGSINDVAFHPAEPIIASASSDKKLFLGEL